MDTLHTPTVRAVLEAQLIEIKKSREQLISAIIEMEKTIERNKGAIAYTDKLIVGFEEKLSAKSTES